MKLSEKPLCWIPTDNAYALEISNFSLVWVIFCEFQPGSQYSYLQGCLHPILPYLLQVSHGNEPNPEKRTGLNKMF